MPIRVITPPKTVEVARQPNEAEAELILAGRAKPPEPDPWPFARFVRHLLDHPHWGRTLAHVRASREIDRALDTATGGAVELAEESWRLLKELLEDPGPTGYMVAPWALRQLLTYMDAVLEAKVKGEG